jgi:hypothetical protein
MANTITYMIPLFSLAMTVLVTTTTMATTAYAEIAILAGIPKEISDALVSQTINRIQNYANSTSYNDAPLISLTDEGVITISFTSMAHQRTFRMIFQLLHRMITPPKMATPSMTTKYSSLMTLHYFNNNNNNKK